MAAQPGQPQLVTELHQGRRRIDDVGEHDRQPAPQGSVTARCRPVSSSGGSERARRAREWLGRFTSAFHSSGLHPGRYASVAFALRPSVGASSDTRAKSSVVRGISGRLTSGSHDRGRVRGGGRRWTFGFSGRSRCTTVRARCPSGAGAGSEPCSRSSCRNPIGSLGRRADRQPLVGGSPSERGDRAAGASLPAARPAGAEPVGDTERSAGHRTRGLPAPGRARRVDSCGSSNSSCSRGGRNHRRSPPPRSRRPKRCGGAPRSRDLDDIDFVRAEAVRLRSCAQRDRRELRPRARARRTRGAGRKDSSSRRGLPATRTVGRTAHDRPLSIGPPDGGAARVRRIARTPGRRAGYRARRRSARLETAIIRHEPELDLVVTDDAPRPRVAVRTDRAAPGAHRRRCSPSRPSSAAQAVTAAAFEIAATDRAERAFAFPCPRPTRFVARRSC